MRILRGNGRTGIVVVSVLMVVVCSNFALGSDQLSDDETILDLSLEDLLDIKVTSVSKRAQSLNDAAAAIFVITNKDLLRWGVTSVPDALRYVPGLHVGRIDSSKWAITSRGFNGRFSNKLLVLVDGRSVYTTSFSGVYWEVQDMMIEDIDRIEIIRGPGSTLWGANAVNGVINIITKNAADTQDGLAVAGAGDIEKGFGRVRWGTASSGDTYARFYAKAFSRGDFPRPDGQDAGDSWDQYRGGFRLDAKQGADIDLTLQGEIYEGTINNQTQVAQLIPPYNSILATADKVSGGNLTGRWAQTLSPTSQISFQIYFDRALRRDAIANQVSNTLDYDFQYHLGLGKHNLVWGLGYRHIDDLVDRTQVFLMSGGELSFNLYSAFIQDEISLFRDRLALTVGSKFEHNDFTGFEIQPSVRLLWKTHPQHRLWGAVSRAVRTPARYEDDLQVLVLTRPPFTADNPTQLPLGSMIAGNPDLQAEELIAYEIGYRFNREEVSLDLTSFYNDYTKLIAYQYGDPDVRYLEDPPYIALPVPPFNARKSSFFGIEAALVWQHRSWLRWDLAYSFIEEDIPDNTNPSLVNESAPKNQANLNLNVVPLTALNLNVGVRYVDSCVTRNATDPAGHQIPSYTTLDARIGWRLGKDVEFSVVGQDLLDKQHYEYAAETFALPTEIPRRFYGQIRLDF